ncbi:hypothetical protein HAX54_019489 [Datura stramonium]|uniref:VQ domain-containing protein n=1 Tax=Datura stramonium TaxID=4076 RepID=A0ABS8S201_DATST|nr:hypothetical protein [Datura stramonium]
MQSSNDLSCVPKMTTRTLNCDTTTTTATTLSPTNSDLSPKNGSITKKPIRRRSRASKKTPTTHLNADASNFRALVQQFTGCHTAHTFLGAHKGPINLNFGLDENDDCDFDAHHNNSTITHVSSFGYDHSCYCNNPKGQKQVKKKVEEQNRLIGSISTTNSSCSPTMDISTLDDFELETLCLDDFTQDIWDQDGCLLI